MWRENCLLDRSATHACAESGLRLPDIFAWLPRHLGQRRMRSQLENTIGKPRSGAIVLALVFLFFQLVMWPAVFGILGEWRAVGWAYAAVGVIWAAAAVGMAAGALWLLLSLGRHRAPLWIGGGASTLAGAVWIGGVLAGIVPCSGPS